MFLSFRARFAVQSRIHPTGQGLWRFPPHFTDVVLHPLAFEVVSAIEGGIFQPSSGIPFLR